MNKERVIGGILGVVTGDALGLPSYKEALLKAVNLGLDTDTVGAVTGGLAGVYYGLAGIPEEWMAKIIKREEILDLGRKFARVII